ncbi:MAG: 2-hydroxyglutaryl-CoA dehydratase, partial [Dehalococcoidia bacterium]
MVFAGCDIGSLTAKAVVMENGAILGSELIQSRARAVQSAVDVMDKLLGKLALSYDDIDYCVSTGYGRNIIPFAHDNVSEISCHGRGARWLVPSVRTIIDGGGQDCKVIKLNPDGVLEDFRINRKCAAGTGRSLEIMAQSLGVEVSQLGPLSLEATDPVILQEPCCIITEIEIRHLILEGRESADIAA